jgi:hypothetical protein
MLYLHDYIAECAALLRFYGIRARIVDFSAQQRVVGQDEEQREDEEAQDFIERDVEELSETVAGQKRAIASLDSTSKAAVAPVVQRLGAWIERHFSAARGQGEGSLPLYCQHYGHSFSIVGLAQTATEQHLVVFDPAYSTQQILLNLTEASTFQSSGRNWRLPSKWRSQLLKPLPRLKQRDYQLLYLAPGLVSLTGDKEYEASKIIDSVPA